MAQKKRRRKPARKQQQEAYPGWMWMLFGLAIGLSVAFAIYMKDRGQAQPPETIAQQPASMSAPIQPEPAPVDTTPEPEEETEPRFSFYNMLPNFEVVIPEEEPDVSRDGEVEVTAEDSTSSVEQPATDSATTRATAGMSEGRRHLRPWPLTSRSAAPGSPSRTRT